MPNLPLPSLLALCCSFAIASTQAEPLKLPPIADGPFKPAWDSLTHYETQEWFRDAKFGIWAHWGPQCQPEHGDWYARNMYVQGSGQYRSHLAEYGHPSTHGFKDEIHEWKAERFDPDKLLKFYKENGAKYFMALANHHDNFDLYDSKYQSWNSVNVGPKMDLIGGWAKAARDNGLRFAVSVHVARAWTWYEVAQGADKDGPFAGVPYDGKLTKADGKGQWWEGLDPQELYEQNHRPGKVLHHNFDAKRGTSMPDNAYREKFFKRTKQLCDDYHPDQIYFDDRVLPFYNIAEEVPLKLAAHFYNTRLDKDGRTEAVMNGKHLDEMQRRTMVYDIERGKADAILPQPWQTDTCIGGWHYDRGLYDRKGYRSAASVVRMLADIVSKNGNLMPSVPLRRDGQPDEQEIEILKEIGAWLKVNGEAIYATRPWKIYGEGPSTEFSEEGHHGGQADVSKKPFTSEDVRFTQSKDGGTLYAIVLEIPKDGKVLVKSPNNHLTLTLDVTANGQVTHALAVDGKPLISPSPVGFSGGRFAGVTRREENSVWKPVWGKRAVVPDRYREVTINLGGYELQARAYDEGVAFRYVFPGQKPTGAEATAFHFAGDYTASSSNGENPNIGPEKLSLANGQRSPVVTIKTDDLGCLALHEADLPEGDPLLLETKQGDTTLRSASNPTTAWRVVLFGRTPGELVDSHLIELLNPAPPAGMDFSWVKPGVALWDWRINGAKVDGFKYEMSLPSWKRMVDFAAENRISHLVLDANWYGPDFGRDSDPTKGGKVDQVKEIIAYGKQKHVGVWLYLNDVGGRKFSLEDTLKQYGEWGAAGVKYGFMNGSPEEKNQRTRLITQLCAKNHLLCDFHDGPVHPYGQMRTWPNAVTREFCQAQLDGHKVVQPKTFATSVFVNMLAGPLDINNGLADLTQAGRVDNGKPVPSTLTGEIARTLIVFSGATVIPDIPEYYRKHPELLRFLAAEQMPWCESKTLSGEIGEYIVMARQATDGTWLIGAATNESPRELEVPPSFLPAGRYEALIIQDGPKSDCRTHAEDYQSETRVVSRTDTLRLKLAPGGGA